MDRGKHEDKKGAEEAVPYLAINDDPAVGGGIVLRNFLDGKSLKNLLSHCKQVLSQKTNSRCVFKTLKVGRSI